MGMAQYVTTQQHNFAPSREQYYPVSNSCDKQGPGSAGVSNIELAHV